MLAFFCLFAVVYSLRIVQYNSEWLFMDPYKTASGYCPGEGCVWKTSNDAAIHMDCVSNVLQTLNADIVHLCEVESINELTMLGLSSDYKQYLVQSTDSATGQNVALLSRVDFTVEAYRVETKTNYPLVGNHCGYNGVSGMEGVSKHMITEFNWTFTQGTAQEPIQIALIGAHLLAQPYDPERCVKREAQASVLRSVLESYLAKGYEVILLGDLNDFDTYDVSNQPISRVLSILKGDDETCMEQNTCLYNLADWLDEKEKYSNWWDSDGNCTTNSAKDYSLIDHILVSNGLLDFVSDVSIYHGYDIYCGKYDSDHYPVIVDFD